LSIAEQGLSFGELFDYTDSLAQRWFAYFEQNPGALDVSIGGRTGTVRELVAHISMAENRLIALLLRVPPGSTEAPSQGLDELRTLHADAHARLREFMSHAEQEVLHQKVEFMGGRIVSRRKVLAQIYIHMIHHWAQIAMAIRQAGFPATKPQDIIASDVMQ
jgi:uncharacterized damage-inducible protein DinB